MRNIVIVAGCRTPIGTINGQFKTVNPAELSIPVMQLGLQLSENLQGKQSCQSGSGTGRASGNGSRYHHSPELHLLHVSYPDGLLPDQGR